MSADQNKIVIIHADEPDPINASIERDNPEAQYEVGQWYWVTVDTSRVGDEPVYEEVLVCCVHIGSNYIQLSQPNYDRPSMQEGSNGYKYDFEVNRYNFRMHFNSAEKYKIRHEPNSAEAIRKMQSHYSYLANNTLAEIKEISKRLGLRMDGLLTNKSEDASTGTSVAVLNGVSDVKEYENALVVAKKQTLPHLFNNLKQAHAGVQQWMGAEALVMGVVIDSMKESVHQINDRLFNVGLYAGLEEYTKQCCEGEPADISEKLHVMQRKLYMDEECLMNYNGGGLEFKDIGAFDEWICQPENRDRILPFPRTIVAMQVRRHTMDRPWLEAYVRMDHAISDKFTYLYVRNGEQVWRISFDKYDFSEDKIFPDKSVFNPSEPMMFKWEWSKVEKFMTVSEFESIRDKYLADKKAYDESVTAWREANPGMDWFKMPYEIRFTEPRDEIDFKKWHKFDESTVYYDDAVQARADEMNRYNRVALIIQGLFDRSPMLAPHMPVKTWLPESFSNAIELTYDYENTLYEGEKPDFKAFMAELNSKATADSVFTGQQFSWMRANAEKQNNKASQYDRHGDRRSYDYVMYVPDYDNGMSNICKAANITKAGVTFKWMREKAQSGYSWRPTEMVESSYRAPWNEVLNVSAYTPGDYKKFFRDPRTREEYLQWAPFLLSAEDYWAKVNAGQDPSDTRQYRSVYRR